MKSMISWIVLAVVALVINLGTTGGLIYLQREELFAVAQRGAAIQAGAVPRFWSFSSGDVDTLVAELKTQRKKLIERQNELDKVATHVEAEKQELEKTRAEVVAMREEISAEVPQIQESERKNLKSLAASYAAMTPTAVVSIFHEMDDMMCVKLLSLMKPASVGAILQQMTQQDKDESLVKRAARISDKLRLVLAEQKPPA